MGKQDGQPTAYNDISAEVKEAKAVAKQAPDFDDDGKVKSADSDAARKVGDELARRGAGTANGGGPWPTDLLVERGTTPLRGAR